MTSEDEMRPYMVPKWSMSPVREQQYMLVREDGLELCLSTDIVSHSPDAVEDTLRLLGSDRADAATLEAEIRIRTSADLIAGWRHMSWTCLCGWSSPGRDAVLLGAGSVMARCPNCLLVLAHVQVPRP